MNLLDMFFGPSLSQGEVKKIKPIVKGIRNAILPKKNLLKEIKRNMARSEYAYSSGHGNYIGFPAKIEELIRSKHEPKYFVYTVDLSFSQTTIKKYLRLLRKAQTLFRKIEKGRKIRKNEILNIIVIINSLKLEHENEETIKPLIDLTLSDKDPVRTEICNSDLKLMRNFREPTAKKLKIWVEELEKIATAS